MVHNNIRSMTSSNSGVQVSNLSNALIMVARPSGYRTGQSKRKMKKTRASISTILEPLYRHVSDPDTPNSGLNLHNVGVSLWTDYFMQGRAAMIVSKFSGVAVGYARLATRMDSRMIEQLNIPDPCPEILELGNLAVAPDYQGNRLAPMLIGKLIDINMGAMLRNELLIIGTMTGRAAARGFKETFEHKGFSPEFRHHLDFVSIAPLTCKCTTEPATGFNISVDGICGLRVPKMAEMLTALNQPTSTYTSSVPNKLPCVLFVSDPNVAAVADQAIGARFSSTSELVGELHRTGYY